MSVIDEFLERPATIPPVPAEIDRACRWCAEGRGTCIRVGRSCGAENRGEKDDGHPFARTPSPESGAQTTLWGTLAR